MGRVVGEGLTAAPPPPPPPTTVTTTTLHHHHQVSITDSRSLIIINWAASGTGNLVRYENRRSDTNFSSRHRVGSLVFLASLHTSHSAFMFKDFLGIEIKIETFVFAADRLVICLCMRNAEVYIMAVGRERSSLK